MTDSTLLANHIPDAQDGVSSSILDQSQISRLDRKKKREEARRDPTDFHLSMEPEEDSSAGQTTTATIPNLKTKTMESRNSEAIDGESLASKYSDIDPALWADDDDDDDDDDDIDDDDDDDDDDESESELRSSAKQDCQPPIESSSEAYPVNAHAFAVRSESQAPTPSRGNPPAASNDPQTDGLVFADFSSNTVQAFSALPDGCVYLNPFNAQQPAAFPINNIPPIAAQYSQSAALPTNAFAALPIDSATVPREDRVATYILDSVQEHARALALHSSNRIVNITADKCTPVIGDNNQIIISPPPPAPPQPAGFELRSHTVFDHNRPVRHLISVNRREEINTLVAQFYVSSIVFIHGHPGVGKTELAHQVARELASTFAGRRFLFDDLLEKTPDDLFQLIGEEVFQKIFTKNPASRCLHLIKQRSPQEFLFVFDGCESLLKSAAQEDVFSKFLAKLVGCGNVKVVATSIDLPKLPINDCETLELKPLTQSCTEEWLRCLNQKLKETEIEKISNLSEGYPLYVWILCKNSVENVDDLKFLNRAFDDLSDVQNDVVSLAGVFDSGFTRETLRRMSKSLNRPLFSSTWNELLKRGIIRPKGHLHSLHGLIRQVVLNSPRLFDRIQIHAAFFFRHFVNILIEIGEASWRLDGLSPALKRYRGERSYFEQVFRRLTPNDEDLEDDPRLHAALISTVAGSEWRLTKTFMFLEYCVSFERLLKITESVRDVCQFWMERDCAENETERSGVRNLLVVALCHCNQLRRRDKPGQNIEDIQQAQRIVEEQRCSPHAEAYFNYAQARSHGHPKDRAKSIDFFRKSISALESWQGSGEVARHRDLDLWEYKMCLAKAESAPVWTEPKKPPTPASPEDRRKAEEVLKECCDKFRKSLGDHEQAATAFKRLGDFLMENKSYEDARSKYRASRDIMGRLETLDLPQMVTLLKNSGNCCIYMKKWREGLAELEEANDLRKKYFPDGNIWTVKVLTDLVDAYLKYGEEEQDVDSLQKAEEYATEASLFYGEELQWEFRKKKLMEKQEKIEKLINDLIEEEDP